MRNSSTACSRRASRLCAFNPLNPLDDRFAGLNQRDHRKIVVVDGEQAFAGGVNFSHAYRIASQQARRRGLSRQKSLDEGWRDTHIARARHGARDTSSELFRETCERREMRRRRASGRTTHQAQKAGDTLLQIVPSTPQGSSQPDLRARCSR